MPTNPKYYDLLQSIEETATKKIIFKKLCSYYNLNTVKKPNLELYMLKCTIKWEKYTPISEII